MSKTRSTTVETETAARQKGMWDGPRTPRAEPEETPCPPGHYRTITGNCLPIPPPPPKRGSAFVSGPGSTPRSSNITKEWSEEVTFPDGQQVHARYTRYGPKACRIEFTDKPYGRRFAKIFYSDRGPGEVWQIQSLLKQALDEGFADAITLEQRDVLKRATPPTEEDKANLDKSTFTMSLEAAKVYAGQYALCEERRGKLLPESKAYASIQAAVQVWKHLAAQGKDVSHLLLCGCCRWKRQWVRLRFDPLVGNLDYAGNPVPASEVAEVAAYVAGLPVHENTEEEDGTDHDDDDGDAGTDGG